jgi:hypothetical protein
MNKIYKVLRLFILFQFILDINASFGQGKNCLKTDSSLCYYREHYSYSEFNIEKKYESIDSVYSPQSPLLADMDGDCIPEFIIPDKLFNNILIIDSKTGRLKWKISTPIIDISLNGLAIGDVDSDGFPEIFFEASISEPSNKAGKLVCIHSDGKLYWISDKNVYPTLQSNEKFGGTPALADFNQDGIPEIYVNNKIFNARTGIQLADGGSNGIGSGRAFDFSGDALTIAAQLDEDSTDLELAAGYSVYKVKIINTNGVVGNSMTPINMQINNEYKDGYTTVADINSDGILDIVVTTPGFSNEAILYAYTIFNGASKLIAKAYPPGVVYTGIGPAFIGDIKGTGKPSIILSRFSSLLAYSFNGTDQFQLDWSYSTTDSSGFTGLTMFDFNNDGIQEIVYRDETNLNIINGSTFLPKLIMKVICYSPTWAEYPVVGDIDNSGHAKICVTCALKHNWSVGNLTIFGPPDSLPGWAPARGIWNQYNYHVLNINDDLTVPRVEKNNATYKNGKYNNFYVQESLLDENGMYKKPAASLWGAITCIHYDPVSNQYTVFFDLHNRRDASMNADTGLLISFYDNNPESGANLLGTYHSTELLNAGDSLVNLNFSFATASLSKLFMVINTKRDSIGVFNPADFKILECDYTDNISQSIELPQILHIDTSICKGSAYFFIDTSIYDAGRYYSKLYHVKGCDSVIHILNLKLTDTVYSNTTITTCDQYTWNGQMYNQSGQYFYSTPSTSGCDSIAKLNLTIHQSSSSNTKTEACDSYSWNGQTYTSSGTYLFNTQNSSACDSTAILNLSIHPGFHQDINRMACNSYDWNGHTYTSSGDYVYPTQSIFGCDSIVTLHLHIDTTLYSAEKQTTCDPYLWNGNIYNQSGHYQFKTKSTGGCDSIAELDLIILSPTISTTTVSACDGYNWNGTQYSASGQFTFTTKNAVGCDSTAILVLQIDSSYHKDIYQSACTVYNWNGSTYSSSGEYTFKSQSIHGCDSIVILHLMIDTVVHSSDQQTACDQYNWNGNVFKQSGNYQYKSKSAAGCDSIAELNLLIRHSSNSTFSAIACDSYPWNGQNYKQSGRYTFSTTNTDGCDSVATLQLTIHPGNDIYLNQTACDTFFWNVNQQRYDQTGVYKQSYTNSNGCDSIYTLNLNIHPNRQFLQTAMACNEYRWPANQMLYRQSGQYAISLKDFFGCDSIIKLNLVIDPEYSYTDTIVSNTAYTWPVNHQRYDSSGLYQQNFRSVDGCDSIFFLYLVIQKNYDVFYPNVINTNSAINNHFTLYNNGIPATIELLEIYDRWGELIWRKQNFPSSDPLLGWDGRFQGEYVIPGVYVWHAQIRLNDGSLVQKKGDLTVVR